MIEAAKSAERKIKYIAENNVKARSAHMLLFELCHQLDTSDKGMIESSKSGVGREKFILSINQEESHKEPDISDFDQLQALLL